MPTTLTHFNSEKEALFRSMKENRIDPPPCYCIIYVLLPYDLSSLVVVAAAD